MWDVKLRRLAANRSAAHGTAFFLTGALLFCGGSGLGAVTAAVASVAVAPAGAEREPCPYVDTKDLGCFLE